MPTPVFLTGFEHGEVSAAGAGLFSAVTGSPTIGAAGTGADGVGKALDINKTSGVALNVQAVGSGTVGVVRFKVKFVGALPTGDVRSVYRVATNGSQDVCLGFSHATSQFNLNEGGLSTVTTQGPTLVADTWYLIEIRANVAANPWAVDWRIAGTAMTQWQPAFAATTLHDYRCGGSSSADTDVYHARYDDWICSQTSGDYPIGDGKIVAMRPTSDGTHSPATPDCITSSGGTLISGSNPAYTNLDDDPFPAPTPASDFVKQTTSTGAHSSHYVEMNLGPDITDAGSVNGVQGLCEVHGSTSSSCSWTVRTVGASAGTTDIHAGAIASSTSLYHGKIIAAPTGGWTQTTVNELVGRAGFATDVSPTPITSALMLEVDYVVSTATTWHGDAALTGAGSTAASGTRVKHSGAASSGAGSASVSGSHLGRGNAALSGAGTSSISSSHLGRGSASAAGTGTATAAGTRIVRGSAALSGAGTSSSSGTRVARDSAALSGLGTASAAGSHVGRGAVSASGTGSAAVSGTHTGRGAASAAGSGSATASGTHFGRADAALTGSGAATSSGTTIVTASAALLGAGSASAAGERAARGAATGSGAGSLATSGTVFAGGTNAAALTGSGTLSAAGSVTYRGAAALSGAGSSSSSGTRAARGAVSASGTGSIAAAATRTTFGSAPLTGSGALAASGRLTTGSGAALVGAGSLQADGFVPSAVRAAVDDLGLRWEMTAELRWSADDAGTRWELLDVEATPSG